MNHLLDDLLVGAVLLVSLGYAFARLGPRTLRQRMLAGLGRILASAPASFRLGGVAQRLSAASGQAQAACGGCDNCGSENTSAPKVSAEISVPVAKIGRRA
jgi:predicted phage tail protein